MPVRVVVCGVGLVLGVTSLRIARDHPGFSFAGSTSAGAVALLGAGWAMLGAGMLFWSRRRGNRIGPLLAVAGCVWLIGEWDNPGVASAFVFTAGLALVAAWPPLVGWVVLGYPDGRLGSWGRRVAVTSSLVACVVGVGVVPALFFDPAATGCAQCPANLLAVSDDPRLVDTVGRTGVWLGLLSTMAVIAVAGWGLVRASPVRRRVVVAVVVTGTVALGLVAWDFAASVERGFPAYSGLDRRLWFAQAGALAAVAVTVTWGRVRARRTRSSLARLVVELNTATRAGSLGDALAGRLGDPNLVVAYAVAGGGYADGTGRPVDVPSTDGRVATPLVRDAATVAVLIHRPGLLDDPGLVDEVAATVRLALENERLQAGLRAQERDLRVSRARVVAAADTERQRLERDLHDGAQQRLIILLLGLRLVQAELACDADGTERAAIDDAAAELQRAVDELRTVARGVYPAALSDEGLAAAFESLVEAASEPIEIVDVPDERYPAAVENTAYRVVAEIAKTGSTRVRATCRGGRLLIDVDATAPPEQMVELEDRVGALDGRIRVEGGPSGVTVRAEIPCE